jgi:hypothetical protein
MFQLQNAQQTAETYDATITQSGETYEINLDTIVDSVPSGEILISLALFVMGVQIEEDTEEGFDYQLGYDDTLMSDYTYSGYLSYEDEITLYASFLDNESPDLEQVAYSSEWWEMVVAEAKIYSGFLKKNLYMSEEAVLDGNMNGYINEVEDENKARDWGDVVEALDSRSGSGSAQQDRAVHNAYNDYTGIPQEDELWMLFESPSDYESQNDSVYPEYLEGYEYFNDQY